VFYGIRPAVVAIVLFAAWRIGSRALRNDLLWGMAALAFVGIFVFHVAFPWIVLAAGLLGALGGKLAPHKFRTGGGHGTRHAQAGPAIIDDDTPPPAHARFSWRRFALTLAAFVLIWLGAMGMLLGMPALQAMGAFFTKAAFLTIGGAYAVLPYVYQGGVEHFQWLTGPQMMDGLALGETTPGPLIMIVTWIGISAASQGTSSTTRSRPDWQARQSRLSSLSCRPSCSSWWAARWSKPPAASLPSLHLSPASPQP